MLGAVKTQVAKAARRSALAGAGALLLCVGLGFASLAAWLVLSEWRDAIFAATVLGLAYLSAGTLALGLAFSRPSPPSAPQAPVPAPNPILALLPAFLAGLEQGRAMRKPHDET